MSMCFSVTTPGNGALILVSARSSSDWRSCACASRSWPRRSATAPRRACTSALQVLVAGARERRRLAQTVEALELAPAFSGTPPRPRRRGRGTAPRTRPPGRARPVPGRRPARRRSAPARPGRRHPPASRPRRRALWLATTPDWRATSRPMTGVVLASGSAITSSSVTVAGGPPAAAGRAALSGRRGSGGSSRLRGRGDRLAAGAGEKAGISLASSELLCRSPSRRNWPPAGPPASSRSITPFPLASAALARPESGGGAVLACAGVEPPGADAIDAQPAPVKKARISFPSSELLLSQSIWSKLAASGPPASSRSITPFQLASAAWARGESGGGLSARTRDRRAQRRALPRPPAASTNSRGPAANRKRAEHPRVYHRSCVQSPGAPE